MPLQIALVGLPNVGKSTLFNALTKSTAAAAANFPFCTIDPNVGIVALEDERLSALSKTTKAKRIVPETIEFVDIAGLVKGASKGEGLGNQFLSHIRECDAVAMVLRFFEDGNVVHVHGKIDPQSDKETIETELILADLQSVEKSLDKAKRMAKSNDKDAVGRHAVLEKIFQTLSEGKRVSALEFSEEETPFLREFSFLTVKPFLFVANVAEDALASFDIAQAKETLGLSEHDELIPISAKIEAELSGLSPEEAEEFLGDFGIQTSGLQQLAHAAHSRLGLARFFTAGEQEARAWTIPVGATAPQAAGKIHTDFEKGFIRADVVGWKDFVEHGGWSPCREKGLVRSEGKEAIIHDGDVCLFKFNV
ncbi:redox-regulated ATPase YchF [Candidatus Peregrinibacteria bacterium]|nr:MAG: redox-regulated ATPase YchF [Candidatus Peregrinibacteria bacterium]